MHYAFVHTYGSDITDGGNNRMGVFVRFADSGERDRFVDRGPDGRTESRYREASDAPRGISEENVIDYADWADFCARTGWPL